MCLLTTLIHFHLYSPLFLNTTVDEWNIKHKKKSEVVNNNKNIIINVEKIDVFSFYISLQLLLPLPSLCVSVYVFMVVDTLLCVFRGMKENEQE